MERQSKDPVQAYDSARFGISISGLEQLMIFAKMKIANPPRTRQMIEDRTGFGGSAKVCFSFPSEGEDLTLTNHCYVAFVDRFYKLDEAALLAFAVHRNDCVLEIIGFSGRVLKPAGPAAQILARIVGFFQDEVNYAVERGETVPELVIPAGEELSIPEGLASLGDRQLNSKGKAHDQSGNCCAEIRVCPSETEGKAQGSIARTSGDADEANRAQLSASREGRASIFFRYANEASRASGTPAINIGGRFQGEPCGYDAATKALLHPP